MASLRAIPEKDLLYPYSMFWLDSMRSKLFTVSRFVYTINWMYGSSGSSSKIPDTLANIYCLINVLDTDFLLLYFWVLDVW